MSVNDCYVLFISGVIKTIAELEWEMFECEGNGNYNIYLKAIHDLLNGLDSITKNIVINEINKQFW